jgi:catechol 2,3-dioxygenase-like lactoylglutathione lyase family enzyme
MTSRLTEVIVDCHDLDLLADFWCAVLGYERRHRGDNWLAIGAPGPEESDESWRAGARAPIVAFVEVPEDRVTKNRVHVDVTPLDTTRDDEVERLLALGATHCDLGQQDRPWVVMADPEGNEFCVMPAIGEERPPAT